MSELLVMDTSSNNSHDLNAPVPSVSMDERLILFNLEHPSNELSPIALRPSGKLIVFKLEHPEKT